MIEGVARQFGRQADAAELGVDDEPAEGAQVPVDPAEALTEGTVTDVEIRLSAGVAGGGPGEDGDADGARHRVRFEVMQCPDGGEGGRGFGAIVEAVELEIILPRAGFDDEIAGEIGSWAHRWALDGV